MDLEYIISRKFGESYKFITFTDLKEALESYSMYETDLGKGFADFDELSFEIKDLYTELGVQVYHVEKEA